MFLLLILPSLAVAVVLVQVFNAVRSPLRNLPGPFLARFTDLWYFANVYTGHFEKINLQLHKKKGKIIRYGPNRYSFDDPDAIKAIYGLHSPFKKSSWYTTFANPGSHSLFTISNPKDHAQMRKLYTSPYSMTSLLAYEPFADECVALLDKRLQEVATNSNNGVVDLKHWLQCYAFDVITYMTYSERLGFLDKGEDARGIIPALDDYLIYASLVGIFPSLHPIIFKIRNFFSQSNQGSGRQYMVHFTQKCIQAHGAADEKNPNGPTDFLSKFTQKHANDPANFTMFHVFAGCMQNILAGADTTTIALSATIYFLLKYPDTLQKLREEIDQHSKESNSENVLPYDTLHKMPYLQAVLKESQRLHSAGGLPFERVVPEGGANICGQYFPAGTIVGVNGWVHHYNKSIFGPDADIFRPERWIDGDATKISMMNDNWLPFGMGSRSCIGRHIAMLEMSKLVPHLLQTYDMELAEPDDELIIKNFWFVKIEQLRVRLRQR